MFTFFSGLLGIVTGVLPEAIGFLKRGQEHKQELEMMKLQFEFHAAEAEMRMAEAEMAGFATQEAGLYRQVSEQRTDNWVDKLNALVRPVITILFTLMFFICIWAVVVQALALGTSMTEAFVLVMPTIDIYFAAIIGFWFGNRALRKKFGG